MPRTPRTAMVSGMACDPACKLLFAHPRTAEDLLRGFFARQWSHALDFSTLEHLRRQQRRRGQYADGMSLIAAMMRPAMPSAFHVNRVSCLAISARRVATAVSSSALVVLRS